MDSFTIVFLLAYLVLLLYGGLSSTQQALEYGERSYSSWRPYMAPIKIVACVGIIARQPVGQLWLAGVFLGLMMAALFIVYIAIRCRLQPHLGPVLPVEERRIPFVEKLALLRAGILALVIFFFMTGLFLMRAMAPPEIGLGDIYRSIVPFVLVMVVALALVMIFPQIALWLPEQHYGR